MMGNRILGWRMALAALTISFVVALAIAPASAQQPASVNPTASSVKEEQLLNALKPGETMRGRVTIPDQNAAILIQPEGRSWRAYHQGALPWVGAIAIIGMLIVLALFYAARGKILVERGFSGRTIMRFAAVERFVHWMTAVSFIILALSGLNISFGRSLVLPLAGEYAFGSMSAFLKVAHNYVAFPFMAGIIFMFVIWIKDNIPGRIDWNWIRQGGGIVGHAHPPARRFNAGQKMIFWSVVLGGAAMSFSGWNMLFPNAELAGGVTGMQLWTMVHGIVAMLMAAVILAHIYIGTVGMEGAFDAMGSGEVDVNWAAQHHSLWLAEEQARAGARAAPAAKMAPAE